MADNGEQGAAASTQPKKEEGGRINTNFIKSPLGIVLIINFIFSFLAFCMMSGFLGDTGLRTGHFGFFMYAVTHTWVALLIIFILKLIKIHTLVDCISWELTFAINTLIMTVILLIGSAVVAQRAAYYSDYHCDYINCHLIGACAFFGFAAMLGCAIQTFFHYKEWRA
ncbi:MARVEL domain-containing protein 1-like [Clytia hemisphaerica]|uniref:MARVEL domain-containing protein n=1 Tax=Clytia hemisphaerica TaxID=252671 RepID=A0A7M6DND0_9CNID|eukprot:TCONS_00012423-protein